MSDFKRQFQNYQQAIDKAIADNYPSVDSLVAKAGLYSLQAGGKRLRPMLFVAFYQALSEKEMTAELLQMAVSLEYAHTASLIHDDLPAIDNDDLRRGVPTCHRQFNEATALMAGDYLLNLSLVNLLQCRQPQLALILGQCINELLFGEQLDILGEKQQYQREQLLLTFTQKTASMFTASLQMAAVLARQDEQKTIKQCRELAVDLGLAFQIQDDVLDVVGQTDKLGKTIGSDEQAGKSTWVRLVGLEQAQADYQVYYQRVYDRFSKLLPDNQYRQFLLSLLEYLAKRDH